MAQDAQRTGFQGNTGYGKLGGSKGLLLDHNEDYLGASDPSPLKKQRTMNSGSKDGSKDIEMSHMSSSLRKQKTGYKGSSQKSRNEMSDPMMSQNIKASATKERVELLNLQSRPQSGRQNVQDSFMTDA